MKKLFPLALAVLCVVPLFGQTVNFRIEINSVFADGIALSPDTPGVTVLSATAGVADWSGLSFQIDDPQLILNLQALADDPMFDDPWVEVPAATGPIAGSNDWNLQRQNLTIGNVPILLITTAPLLELQPGDFVGIVGSTTPVPSTGAVTINFTGSFQWDDFVLGEPGSINLAQIPVPEPGTYALVFGLIGLGLVMWRRRR